MLTPWLVDATSKGTTFRNITTNVNRAEIERQLLDSGFTRRALQVDKNVVEFERDGARYVLRDHAASTGDPTADFYPDGITRTLEIRIRG